MRVEFLDKFGRDLDKISSNVTRQSVRRLILRLESAGSLREIPQLKKLSGFKSAYRVRLGEYRVGLFIEGDQVQFARIAHRKDIYKMFP